MGIHCNHWRQSTSTGSSRIFPVSYTDPNSDITNPTLAYDTPQGNENPVTMAGQTTYAYNNFGATGYEQLFYLNFGSITSKSIKVVLDHLASAYSVYQPFYWTNCGNGYLAMEQTYYPADPYLDIAVSTDGGASWTTAWTFYGAGIVAKQSITLGTYTGDVSVRFVMFGDTPVPYFQDPECDNLYLGSTSSSSNTKIYLCYGE